MFRHLKKASVTLGIAKGDESDVSAKKRLRTVVEALATVKKHAATVCATHEQATAARVEFYNSLRAFYPTDEPFAAKIDALVSRVSMLQGEHAALEAARTELNAACARIADRERALLTMLEERERLRIDIQHFDSQMPRLKERAAKYPREQIALDDNVAKRNEHQIKFDELESRLVPELVAFDAEIARTVDPALAKWMDTEIAVHQSSVTVVSESKAASVSPLKEAAAAAAAADAYGAAAAATNPAEASDAPLDASTAAAAARAAGVDVGEAPAPPAGDEAPAAPAAAVAAAGAGEAEKA